MGERITALAPPEAVRAATAVLLLAPSPPLLFMGQEWAAPQPFLYFCDFDEPLAGQVRDGRRREFASFPEFRDERARERIPDPVQPSTFEASMLNWADMGVALHREWLDYTRNLLALRGRYVVPRLAGARADGYRQTGERCILVAWRMGDGSRLTLHANLGPGPAAELPSPPGAGLFATHDLRGGLPGWSVAWFLS